MKLLKNKRIRVSILRLLQVLVEEKQTASTFARALWMVYDNRPLTIFIDDAGRVTTRPEIPIEVVHTSEL